jgi:DNA-binding IclR family transcriptional regulator
MSPTPDSPPATGADSRRPWSLLSNHGLVLVCLARDPHMRMRDIAAAVGITERACYRIVGDLEQGGFLRRERVGRNNRYVVDTSVSMRHASLQGVRAADVLSLA